MSFWERIRTFFRQIWYGVEKVDKQSIETAIKLVNAIKTCASIAEVLALATPTQVDNLVLNRFNLFLVSVQEGLVTVNRFAPSRTNGQPNSLDDVLKNIQRYIDTLPDWERKGYFHALATELTVRLQDGKLSWHEAATLTQIMYDKIKNDYR